MHMMLEGTRSLFLRFLDLIPYDDETGGDGPLGETFDDV